MAVSRQEHWSGLACPPPWDLPVSVTEPESQVFCIGRWILYHFTTWGAPICVCVCVYNLTFFWLSHMACGIFAPWPGIEHWPPQWSPNPWTGREFPFLKNLTFFFKTNACTVFFFFGTHMGSCIIFSMLPYPITANWVAYQQHVVSMGWKSDRLDWVAVKVLAGRVLFWTLGKICFLVHSGCWQKLVSSYCDWPGVLFPCWLAAGRCS